MTTRDGAMHALLVGLAVGLFVLQPLADLGWVRQWLPGLVTLATLLAGMLALHRQASMRWSIAACGAVLAVGLALRNDTLGGAGAILGLALLSFALLRQVLAAGEVTRQRVEGAVALYLLVALLFASAYEVLEATMPGSFAGATSLPQTFRYFSLVVQTSTGFGDIAPAAPLARTIAALQAVMGQMFIAILLARLVSLELKAERRG